MVQHNLFYYTYRIYKNQETRTPVASKETNKGYRSNSTGETVSSSGFGKAKKVQSTTVKPTALLQMLFWDMWRHSELIM